MRNPILRISCLMALLALIASAVHGAPITVPTDLNVGDQYRLAFLTSTTRDATSSNIDDYNDFVTAVAESVPELLALNTTWTAIGSTDTVDARDNTNTNPTDDGVGVPIYGLDGTRIANDNADLWDGILIASLLLDENGAESWVAGGVFIPTGTARDGIAYISSTGYPLPLGAAVGSTRYGEAGRTNRTWVSDSNFQSYIVGPMYGFSAPLTYIPEPGTAVLMMLGLAALALRGKRRHH